MRHGDTRLDLFKLKAISKVSGIISTVISGIVLAILLLLVIICFTIALSLLIGAALGHYYLGFLIMAVVYIIIGFVMFNSRVKLLKTPISNKFIKDFID